MSDWADDKAFSIWEHPGGGSELRRRIAQALRDVRRDTAEECTKIIILESSKHYGSWAASPAFMSDLVQVIRKRFLKEGA